MNCPYCNKHIFGITGLQELQKFRKHLRTCRKHPGRKMVVDENDKLKEINPGTSLLKALDIRHDSGQ